MPYTEFYGSVSTERYEQSSIPEVPITVHEADVWPVYDNAAITKDSLLNANGAYNGVHPVVAIGGRTAADGRPLNLTGVVMSVTPSSTLAESQGLGEILGTSLWRIQILLHVFLMAWAISCFTASKRISADSLIRRMAPQSMMPPIMIAMIPVTISLTIILSLPF